MSTDFYPLIATWSRLQELPRANRYPSDYLLLLAALDMGWEIVEPVRFNAPREGESRGSYLFSLTHPLYLTNRQVYILQSEEIDTYIQKESLAVLRY